MRVAYAKTGIWVVALLIGLASMAQARDDLRLCPASYHTMSGLDGREGYCADPTDQALSYTGLMCGGCMTTLSTLRCEDDYGTGANYVETSGMVGVSKFISTDKAIVMAGSIQPHYDDGQEASCSRVRQTYTIVDRTNESIPGLTNTMFGLRLPSVCAAGEPVCQWSTMYAAPVLPDVDFNTLSDQQRFSIGVRFPETTGRQLLWHSLAPGPNQIRSTYMAWLETLNPLNDDLITITQTIYKPNNAPYFDITWSMNSLMREYENVKFHTVIDTFTAGNDFGYGYLCDVTKIAGGTGGSAFFQGVIAMHPSAKQFEGWWAEVFHRVKEDSLPSFEWSTPLAPDPVDPTRKVIPLTRLDDNAIAHEWENLTIGPETRHISIRWTFNDPILQSTHATPRSLFVVASDDLGYRENPGDESLQPITPTLFDIENNPRSWRSRIWAHPMPRACTGTEQCRELGGSEICLDSHECSGTEGCPKYCALSRCPNGSCGSSQVCVFGFCMAEEKWKTEDLNNHEPAPAQRRVFTFDTSGNRYWFTPGGAISAHLQTLIDADDIHNLSGAPTLEANDLINWVLGSLNSDADAEGLIIPSNETHEYDLHRPEKTLPGSPPQVVRLLRERYDDDEKNQWLLGDISHADPVYVGAHPSNSWGDVGKKPYRHYYNHEDYQKRKPVLLVAANDGMLHCYDAISGEELWAFVPWDVLPRLVDLSKPFYEQLRTPSMDLRPVVHDAFDEVAGGDGQWRTVLMVGSRGGGDHYWAMEITPPVMHLGPSEPLGQVVGKSSQNRVKFMWYFADEDLGLTYSIPTSGRFVKQIPADPSDPDVPPAYSKWLVFLGSGYARNSAAQMQKLGYFYVLSMFEKEGSSETKIKTIAKLPISKCPAAGICGSEIISGFGAEETPANMRNNVLSSPVVADAVDLLGNDGPDGFEDTVYIGDSIGHLMRFTFTPPLESEGSVQGTVLFNTFRAPAQSNPGEEESLYAYQATVENLRLAQYVSGSTSQKYSFYKYPRPITVRPVVWRTTDPKEQDATFIGSALNANKMMVFFGTGKYDAFYDSFDEYMRDPNAAACQTWPYGAGCIRDFQTMFGIVDRRDGNRVTYTDLIHNEVEDTTINAGGETVKVRTVKQVSSVGEGGDQWKGWYLLLNSTDADNRGEKVITEPVVWEQENMFRRVDEDRKRQWIVFFTTFTPNMQGTCDIRTVNDAGGGYLMTLDAEFGGNPKFAIQDVTRNSILDSNDAVGSSGEGYAGQKFTGSILSRVDVDPYQKVLYVKTGPDNPVLRIQVAGLPYMRGAKTTFYRVK